MVVLSSLEPNTTYEIRVAAVNGKGQGDYSKIEIFQTLPVRKYSAPPCSLSSEYSLENVMEFFLMQKIISILREVNYVSIEVFFLS